MPYKMQLSPKSSEVASVDIAIWQMGKQKNREVKTSSHSYMAVRLLSWGVA